MTITDRDITKEELHDIYEDFKKIELQDGIPDTPQTRYQFVAEDGGAIVGLASGLTNHKWFYLTDMWVHEDFRRQGLGAKLLKMLEAKNSIYWYRACLYLDNRPQKPKLL